MMPPAGRTARMAFQASILALAIPMLAWCGGSRKKVEHPGSGEEGKSGEVGGSGGSGVKFTTHLVEIQAKPIEPPGSDEAAGAVEKVVAFDNVAKLVECEYKTKGWHPFKGTIVIQVVIDEKGNLEEAPMVVLTTSPGEGGIEACLEEAIKMMDFSTVPLDLPATFHVILKYTD